MPTPVMRMHGNYLHNFAAQASAVPAVGMGATVLYYTDRSAVTIIEVRKNGREVLVQEDFADRTDNNGMSESQSYSYRPNPNGLKVAYSLRNNGTWVKVGDSARSGLRLQIGTRNHYHDYSF